MIIIIQARSGSSRFPNKILEPLINKKSVLEFLTSRVSSKFITDKVIIATTCQKSDYKVEQIYHQLEKDHPNLYLYRGSNLDVLDRFYQASRMMNPLNDEIIVRITSDCPLLDLDLIKNSISIFTDKYDYLRFSSLEGFPDGFDFEFIRYRALKNAWKYADSSQREHVSSWIYEQSDYKKIMYSDFIKYPQNQEIRIYNNIQYLNNLYLSLDTRDDLVLIKNILHNLDKPITIGNVIGYIIDNRNRLNLEYHSYKHLKPTPADLKYNIGAKLYQEKGKKLILNGTNLLSKRPELLLPGYYPTYYQKAEGIEITTLDGYKLLDFGSMSVGACILGYQDPDVDQKVIEAIETGMMSSLNNPTELDLAEKLIKLHPWSNPGMIKLTRGSGEACSMAVRIARAVSGKDVVAFCGYHGWHDWYLSANLSDSQQLNDHLLPGLEPLGVPKALKGTAKPFKFNQFKELQQIADQTPDLGVIIMEVYRSIPPTKEFLQQVRDLCNERKIILIFDEITSGFRCNLGGIHMLYGIYPDLCVFGKGLGNGYPISAVLGKKEIMEKASNAFISSTYWTEKIGTTAGLATINKMEELDLGTKLKNAGLEFQKKIQNYANEIKLDIKITGIPSLFSFTFLDTNNNPFHDLINRGLKTYYTQLMYQRGILASTSLYLCYVHLQNGNLGKYFEEIKEVFPIIKQTIIELEKKNNPDEKEKYLKSLLWGDIATPKFGRLN